MIEEVRYNGFPPRGFIDLGRQIDKAQSAYSNAIGQLSTGTDNLVGQAVKLKEFGLRSNIN